MFMVINQCAQYKLKKLFTKHDSRNTQVSVFFKKINYLASHAVVGTREDLSIDVSITTVGLISTKLG